MAEKNLGDLKAKFKVDVDQMDKLVKGVKSIRTDFDALNKTLKTVNEQLNKTLRALQGIQKTGGVNGAGGKTSNPAAGGIDLLPQMPSTTNIQNNYLNVQQGASAAASGGTAVTAGRGGGGMGTAANYAMQALGQTISALNARMDSNYDRSLGADKLGVYYQQQRGITQMQYVEGMRRPMMDQRLGYGGISTLLSMQASTGLSAQGNAAGIAGMRATSGYSISTEQFAQQAATLAGPSANNRLTMMLGTGMYGLGGKQKSMDKVMQQIVQRTGLTNEGRLAGARQAGSNTRAMLLASGVPEDMVDQVLDYANANVQYQKKTGKTAMYDPSKKSDRQVMGIEKNFATQAEETARVKEGRDENYYKRQGDNLAQFEKNTQAVTAALGALEDKLSGIVGANISTRGGIQRKLTGGAFMLGGAALAAFGGPPGIAAGMGMMAAGGAVLGDAVRSEKVTGNTSAKVPMGYASPAKRVSLGELANSTSFRGLNSQFKDRLMRMFAANPNVGLGVGTRTESEQRTMFLSRYKKVTDGSKGDVTFDGEQYNHISGAPAAPPGRSMHEIGLAADLVGDLDWVQEHAAEFGLKTFGKNLGEPWHIQPAELPDSRWEYEKQGSPWGQPAGSMKGSVEIDKATGEPKGGYVVGDKIFSKYTPSGNGGAETFNQVSISSILAGPSAEGFTKMDGVGESAVARRAAYNENSSRAAQAQGTSSGKTLEGVELAQMLRRRFKDKDVATMMAIAYRESRWQPTAEVHDSDDDSYGLFQINMKGNLGPGRRKQYGLTNDRDLLDPATNIKAARLIFGDGQGLKHWSIDGNPMANTSEGMAKAQVVTKQLGIAQGDPMANEPSRGGTTVNVAGGTSVTIAPNIYVTSSGNNSQDASRMAHEIARLLENNIKRELLRTT